MGRITAKLASRNVNKLRELRRALPGWTLELLDADGFPPEDGETYYDNARAKARFGRGLASSEGQSRGHVRGTVPRAAWVLGEDSGLEVDALGGGPGVQSARWARGEHVERLLRELRGVGDRRARYVCELVCLSPDGDELRGTGTLTGWIAETPRGSEGFGFDPVFVPEGEDRTVAELGDDWKAENSHRARAARALAAAVVGASG